jgi:DNA-binding IscR family transcriptional regulator
MIMPVSWLFEGDDKDELKKDSERINEHKKKEQIKHIIEEINKTFDKNLDEIYIDFLIEFNIPNGEIEESLRKFIKYYKEKSKI